MNAQTLKEALAEVSSLMDQNRDYLVELDQQNGDGDLGISMSAGYKAVTNYLAGAEEKDLGKLFMNCGRTFNEAAPSSLGTITAIGLLGMAKALKGKETADLGETAAALEAGIKAVMEKAKSAPGEKTILDALCPALEALKSAAAAKAGVGEAFKSAAAAAAEGSEKTKAMKSVHGRAAYYGDKSIGILDGGSVVGKLIFEGISASLNRQA